MFKKTFILLATLAACLFFNFVHAVQWQYMFNIDSQKQGEKIAIYVDKDSIVKKGDITELTIRFDASTYPNSSVDCKNKKLYVHTTFFLVDSPDNPIYTLACSSKWSNFFSK
jgi:hypothetical protein